MAAVPSADGPSSDPTAHDGNVGVGDPGGGLSAVTRSPGYAVVLREPSVGRIIGSGLLSRTAGRMWTVALVLFVLRVFGSPGLTGIVVFVGMAPGLLLAPVAGALLDRHGRALLAIVDFCVVATSIVTVVVLHRMGDLTSGRLLLLVGLGSTTITLSTTGMRSLLPQLVAPHLWDRINAIDGSSDEIAAVVGPAMGGLLVAVVGPDLALLITASVYLAAAVPLIGLKITAPMPTNGSLFGDARSAVAYVWNNLSLRGLALGLSTANIGLGAIVVALPLVVATRLGAGDFGIGLVWAFDGACAVAASLVVGRGDTVGRERRLLIGGVIGSALGLLLLGTSFGTDSVLGWAGVLLAIAIHGASAGPLNIGLFALRQRRTDPAWFGRATAVSMSVNFAGYPLGAAFAGEIAGLGLLPMLAIASGATVVGALLLRAFIPATAAATPSVMTPPR